MATFRCQCRSQFCRRQWACKEITITLPTYPQYKKSASTLALAVLAGKDQFSPTPIAMPITLPKSQQAQFNAILLWAAPPPSVPCAALSADFLTATFAQICQSMISSETTRSYRATIVAMRWITTRYRGNPLCQFSSARDLWASGPSFRSLSLQSNYR